MNTPNPNNLFDFADQLALVSSQILHFRIKNRATLIPAHKTQLEDIEIKLDKATALVRSEGIAALGDLTNTDRAEVEAATSDAEMALRRIKKVERAFEIANSVLNLALAITQKKPTGILSALKEVRNAIT